MVDSMFSMHFQQELESSFITTIYFNAGNEIKVIRLGAGYTELDKVEVLPSGFCINNGSSTCWYNYDFISCIKYYKGEKYE